MGLEDRATDLAMSTPARVCSPTLPNPAGTLPIRGDEGQLLGDFIKFVDAAAGASTDAPDLAIARTAIEPGTAPHLGLR